MTKEVSVESLLPTTVNHDFSGQTLYCVFGDYVAVECADPACNWRTGSCSGCPEFPKCPAKGEHHVHQGM